jgi:hypothetical protein
MHTMHQDQLQHTWVLHCMACVLTPHINIHAYEFSLVNYMFIYLFIYTMIFVFIFNYPRLFLYSMLTCFIYIHSFTSLVTKGYHGCKFCGASLKSRWDKQLSKPVSNWSRVILLEQHPYRRETYVFNGKLERTQRPAIMTST